MYFLILSVLIKGALAMTVTSVPEIFISLGSNAAILLNCSFEKQTGEFVKFITWSKESETGETYRPLARFYANGIVYFDPDLRDRSNSSTFEDGSTSAILNISEVRCEDYGKYICIVGYSLRDNILTSTNVTEVHIEVKAETSADFSLQPNSSLEEHNVVNFSCLANVRHPQGKVIIWKRMNTTDPPVELGHSSLSDKKTTNCPTTAHFAVLYNLTKYDNGAVFWCTTHNRYTLQNPARSTDIGPLNILYGPSMVSIVRSPKNNVFVVGDRIRLTCISDGNPSPTLQWTFNFTDVVNGEKYHLSEQNEVLQFNIDKITENGYYHCIASNFIKGKTWNVSERILLKIQEKSSVRKSCINVECPFFDRCTKKDDTSLCSTDVWKLIGFVFITFSFVLGMTTASLWAYLKLRKQILKGMQIRDEKDRGYETVSSGITQRNLEERNYEALDNGITHTYSTINESAISRDGKERNYESLSSGETHTYTSITTPTVPM